MAISKVGSKEEKGPPSACPRCKLIHQIGHNLRGGSTLLIGSKWGKMLLCVKSSRELWANWISN
eukprot:852734-Pelagomonas_calceolata.AAC.7